jgi:hypothetical protein
MTLPASGAISISAVNIEIGQVSTFSTDMAWIKANAKTTINGAVNVISDFNSLHDKAWYANNTAGACNNGNCTTGSGNCGNINCANCFNTSLTNCVNCDGATSFLQPNCNCACTYNCTSNQVSINCNCACPIFCACACSDVRLKQQIEPIQNPLDMLDQLNGVYYTWNGASGYYGKTPGQRTMGTIAQHTQKVIPEATGMYKDVLTIDPDGVNGLLIESIKELRKEVNELKQGLK